MTCNPLFWTQDLTTQVGLDLIIWQRMILNFRYPRLYLLSGGIGMNATVLWC